MTQCTVPPPLTEDQISLVLDGIADEQIDAHLKQCPGCAARVADARRFEHYLGRKLDRWDCPSPQQLGDYQLGLLDGEQTGAIRLHLDICHLCQSELETLQGFLAAEQDEAPREARLEAPSRGIRPGELLAQLLPSRPASAMAGLRGSGPEPIVATAGEITLFMEVEAGPGGLYLRGQIAAADQGEWGGALVMIHQAGRIKASAIVDRSAAFLCGPLDPGEADLRITSEQRSTLVVDALTIEAP